MKKFRVAVAGCGNMSNQWIKYAISRGDTQIVALMDISEDSAKSKADKYNLQCRVYTDLPEAIEKSDANLVFDITVPEAHKNTVITALEKGCHVFGEKPMAASMSEAVSIVEAAENYGKRYSVMQNRRYLKNIRAFRQLLSSGTIGQTGFICADFFLGPHFGGFREAMDSPLVLDMAIHTFDQARFISGADPVSVYCCEFNPPGSWYKGDAAAICIFEMSDGSIFCYRGSWCAQGCNTSWEASWRVTGSMGTAMWDGVGMPFCETLVSDEENRSVCSFRKMETEAVWNGREGHFGCLDEMFNSLIEERSAETDCRDNIKSMSMVFGAIESSHKGKKIKL